MYVRGIKFHGFRRDPKILRDPSRRDCLERETVLDRYCFITWAIRFCEFVDLKFLAGSMWLRSRKRCTISQFLFLLFSIGRKQKLKNDRWHFIMMTEEFKELCRKFEIPHYSPRLRYINQHQSLKSKQRSEFSSFIARVRNGVSDGPAEESRPFVPSINAKVS